MLKPLTKPVVGRLMPIVKPVAFFQEDENTEKKAGESGDKQQPQDPETGKSDEVDQDGLEALRKRVESLKQQFTENEAIDATTKSESLVQINKAAEWLQKAAGSESYLKTETVKREQFQQAMDRLQQELKQMADAGKPSPDSTLEVLNSELKAKTSQLQSMRDQLKANRDQITERERRLTQLPGLRESVDEQIREVKKNLSELEAGPEGDETSLSRLILESKLKALELESRALSLESIRQEQAGRRLPLLQDRISRDVKRLQEEVQAWGKRAEEKRQQEIEAQQKAAAQALAAENPVLRGLARENQQLTTQRNLLTTRMSQLKTELEDYSARNQKVEQDRKKLKDKIETIGLTTTTGMELVDHRRSLPPPARSRNRLAELTRQLREMQSRKLALTEQRESISVSDEYVNAILEKNADAFARMDLKDAKQKTVTLLQDQLNFIDALLQDYESYRADLSAVEVAHRTLISNVEESLEFSNKNALWVRSANPLSLDDVGKSAAGIQSFFGRRSWQQLAESLWQHAASRPYELGLMIIVIGAMFMVQRRLKWSHE